MNNQLLKRKSRYILPILTSILLLIGCVNGIPSVIHTPPKEVKNNTGKLLLGIPILLSLNGSYAVLDDEWAVTAGHNRFILNVLYDEVHYHPLCDIAVFRFKSENRPVGIGKIYENQKVFHAGYPAYFPMFYEEGKYVGDVISVSKPKCVASMSTSVIVTGMSGGGVYNPQKELVGINVGFMREAVKPSGEVISYPAIWQSLYGVREWLEEVTGKQYYEGE